MIPKMRVYEELLNTKVVAVIRGENAEEATAISEAALAGGMKAIEVTYTTPGAGQVIERLSGTEALVGAGTVLDAETARHALLAGAAFIVSPHFNPEVARLCNRYSTPYLPGCMTIKEMVMASEAGCDILKLFPANGFEPSFIKSVQGPLPNVRIMPTGGINKENMNDWLAAGAVAVGVGSDLTKTYRASGREAVTESARNYMAAVQR